MLEVWKKTFDIFLPNNLVQVVFYTVLSIFFLCYQNHISYRRNSSRKFYPTVHWQWDMCSVNKERFRDGDLKYYRVGVFCSLWRGILCLCCNLTGDHVQSVFWLAKVAGQCPATFASQKIRGTPLFLPLQTSFFRPLYRGSERQQ